MNILIIEDDKLALMALKLSIESLNHKVTTSENVEEAINKIVAGKFDLVFSDIMMPGISGLSLLPILRTVHLSKIPVIVMSVLSHGTIVKAAYEAGANDFLIKPFTLENLAEKLKKIEMSLNGTGEKIEG